MKINRRLLLSFDWLLLLGLLLLTGAGLLAIWSTTEGTGLNSYFGRQIIYFCLAMLAFLILLYFDYHLYSDYISIIYAVGMVALVVVLLVGKTVHNNRSWISLGGFNVQPSEFVKIIVIIALAKYYADSERSHLQLSELFIGALIVLIPTILVVLEGDLGTAITFVPIYAVLSLLCGVRRKHLIIVAIIAAIAAPAGWMMLKEYQRGRIKTVFNPLNDPRGLGYQTIQSEIAIGSGRFLGKGLKQGSQGQLGFLPARHTDFVFAVLAEQKGFVGSAVILSLFLLITYRILRAAREAKDQIGMMIIVGVLALFLFHLVINIGMVLGWIPVAGIPLPFISAGGSSLVSFFMAMGICMNIRMRRYVN